MNEQELDQLFIWLSDALLLTAGKHVCGRDRIEKAYALVQSKRMPPQKWECVDKSNHMSLEIASKAFDQPNLPDPKGEEK